MTVIAAIAVASLADRLFHYTIPDALLADVMPGVRVLVPFGARRVAGLVLELVEDPGTRTLSPIASVLDETPAIDAELLGVCKWVSEYYEAPLGDVIKMALPVGSEVKVTARLTLTNAGKDALANAGTSLDKATHALLLRAKRGLPRAQLAKAERDVATRAVEQGLLTWEQRQGSRVQVRGERWVQLGPGVDVEAYARAHPRAARKHAVLQRLAVGPLPAADVATPVLRDLVRADLVVIEERAQGAIASVTRASPTVAPPLTAEQTVACSAILSTQKPALLFGITGSGKTEVYLHVIADVLAKGRGAIVLVPEISLTPQLAARFAGRFGDQVAVLHSGLRDAERAAEWARLRSGQARIALGARSAVFAPVADLGIIVIDEEHDTSFKQEEGVRYHARDVALVRAHRMGIPCVMGSATPSMESLAHARSGNYQLLRMSQRPTGHTLPAVEIIDLRTYRPDGEAMLSAPLREAVAQRLTNGEQVILFLNRRGHSTFVLCTACGHRFRCAQCAVSLTYHHARSRLLCHYCGHTEPLPSVCPACAAPAIERKGLGTERVAIALAEQFPTARIARLDRDTASSLEALLARMHRREIDILVGTQMVTKGHDFPGVTLVGVLCADTALDLPDFRASERTFGLLAQVAGRAGRGDKPGHVIVQTYKPKEPAIALAATHDVDGFFANEVAVRTELGYPPAGKQVALRLSGKDDAAVAAAGVLLARCLPTTDGLWVRGPAPAPLSPLRGVFRHQIWLRSADRSVLRRALREVHRQALPKGIRLVVDVDPQSTL